MTRAVLTLPSGRRRRAHRPPVVHIAASLGGHLELLEALEPAIEGFAKVWVTSQGVRADRLRARGQTVLTVPRLDRSSLSADAVLDSARLAVRQRPSIVLTSGAGLVVPFCAVSRALGASLLFVETMARVHRPSMSGRLVSRLGARVFVQWKELQPSYREATLCRPLLLEGVGSAGVESSGGTFVTLGSHDQPFSRLADLVRAAARAGHLPRPVIVQDSTSGATPAWADEHHPFVTPDVFAALIDSSRVVISHGGAGALATALNHGRRPIVIPRLKRFSEHVDDHQLDLVDKLESLGLIVRGDRGISPKAVAAAAAPVEPLPELANGLSLPDAIRESLARI